ncbi:ATP-dependent DNA ligase [Nonomuraea endophytica]|uniref:ATP-dependent DNA ligase n=1 Tax=Nonomuraea endophytica TaxID=714136 RepID=A0A7W8EJC3_9ACTN|nr:ATP-dependent DNA ligase [Nonomuraea endophytica]
MVYDVLRHRGRDVTGLPLRALLQELFAPVLAAGVLALGMQTLDEAEARSWYATMHVAGVEGLEIKATDSRYEGSARGWQKLKYRTSVEAVVSGYVGRPGRPSGLLPGRNGDRSLC